jgi:hypothetical protein
LKRLCSFNQNKLQPVVVESIKQLSPQEQAEAIADKFSKVIQEYEPLEDDDIAVPHFEENEIPQFSPKDVKKHLEAVK